MNEFIINFKNSKYSVDVIDEAGQSVVAEIFKYREYRQTEPVIIEAQPDEYIIDAGAHLGFFGIYTRALNPKVKIICLEPNNKNFEVLQKNILKNEIKKIELLNIGLSADSGERQFTISPDSHDSKMTNQKNSSENIYLCDTMSLANLIKKYKIKKIVLLKMDIEGAEFEIIENMGKKDFCVIKNIFFEYHNFTKNGHKKLEKILRENGFSVQIFPSKFQKNLGFIYAKNKQ